MWTIFKSDVCYDFAEDNFYIIHMIVYETLDTLVSRSKKYQQLLGKEQISSVSLALPDERLSEYVDFFKSTGLSDEQLRNAVASVVELGVLAKPAGELASSVQPLLELPVPKAEIIQFISDNAWYICNDYSRNIPAVVAQLMNENGAIGALKCLQEHPELLRTGIR